jgi:hypothetical protein
LVLKSQNQMVFLPQMVWFGLVIVNRVEP